MSFDTLLKDYTETKSLREWREANHVEINAEFLRLANKRESVRSQLAFYSIVIAFVVGMLIGVSI